jgi:hypothetical protein
MSEDPAPPFQAAETLTIKMCRKMKKVDFGGIGPSTPTAFMRSEA